MGASGAGQGGAARGLVEGMVVGLRSQRQSRDSQVEPDSWASRQCWGETQV